MVDGKIFVSFFVNGKFSIWILLPVWKSGDIFLCKKIGNISYISAVGFKGLSVISISLQNGLKYLFSVKETPWLY